MDFDKQNPENVWTPFRKGSLVMDFSWSCWNVVASKPSLSWPRTGPGLYNILQEEQSLCFLKALQNIHFGQPRITFSSPFCVAGVGRSIITLF